MITENFTVQIMLEDSGFNRILSQMFILVQNLHNFMRPHEIMYTTVLNCQVVEYADIRMLKRILQIFFPVLGLAVLVFVLSVSIRGNGGIGATFSTDRLTLSYNLFRLAGLTAFTLVSFQIATGPYMHLWKKLYGDRFYLFHSYEGLFVLLFALLHWGLIHLYMAFADLSISEFSFLYEKPYIYFGPIALILIGLTVSTAALAVFVQHKKSERWWRYIHYANYAVFLLVFFHSMRIGSDVARTGSPLKPLWWIFFALFVVGFFYRRVWRVREKLLS